MSLYDLWSIDRGMIQEACHFNGGYFTHMRIDTQRDHIETLKEQLEKANQREEDLKQIHNNYMLQVQSLINQKAIEGPGAKKIWWKFW